MLNANFLFPAPETQTRSMASFASDMFSVGLLIATIYNRGQSPIQANHSSQTYIRLIDTVSNSVFCKMNKLI